MASKGGSNIIIIVAGGGACLIFGACAIAAWWKFSRRHSGSCDVLTPVVPAAVIGASEPRPYGRVPSKESTEVNRFAQGQRVKSLVFMAHWKPRALMKGDEGTVIGVGHSRNAAVNVDFGEGLTGWVQADSLKALEEKAEEDLADAMETGDIQKLKEALECARRCGVRDTKINDGQKILDELEAERSLVAALDLRDLDAVRGAIIHAEDITGNARRELAKMKGLPEHWTSLTDEPHSRLWCLKPLDPSDSIFQALANSLETDGSKLGRGQDVVEKGSYSKLRLCCA